MGRSRALLQWAPAALALAGSFALQLDAHAAPKLADAKFSVRAWPAPGGDDKNKRFEAALTRLVRDAKTDDAKDVLCWLTAGFGLQLKGCPEVEDFTGLSTPVSSGDAKAAVSWETAALLGLTDFLVERAKSELRQWIITGLLEDLCPAGQAQEYLQETCAAARQLAQGIPVTDAAFLKSFRLDLKTLPAYLVWQPNQEEWGYVVTNYFDALHRGSPALLLTAGLADTEAIRTVVATQKCATPNRAELSSGACTIFWASIFSQAAVWSEDLSVMDREKTIKRFLAGIYVALDETNFAWARQEAITALSAKLELVRKDEPKLRRLIRDLDTRITASDDLVKNIKAEADRLQKLKSEKTDAKTILAVAARIAELSARLVGEAIALPQVIDGFVVPDKLEELRNALKRTEAVAHIAGLFSANQYAEVLNEISVVLSCVARARNEVSGLDCKIWPHVAGWEMEARLLARHLPLVVGLADAKSPEEFKAVLDNAASPVGTWRFKRQRSMSSLTGFVGFQAGYERLSGSGVDSYGGSAAGMFVPVGLSLTWPTSDGKNAYGVLVSLIDLGNLASARISGKKSDEVANTTTDVKLRHVIAPGLYLQRGFRNSPMVWGGGVTYTPGLRQARLAGGGETEVNSLRFGLFLAVDVTILAF